MPRDRAISKTGLSLKRRCDQPLLLLPKPAPAPLDRRDHLDLMLRHRATSSARMDLRPSAYLSKAVVTVEIRDNQTIAAKVSVLLFKYLAPDQPAPRQCQEFRLSGQVSRLNSLELHHI